MNQQPVGNEFLGVKWCEFGRDEADLARDGCLQSAQIASNSLFPAHCALGSGQFSPFRQAIQGLVAIMGQAAQKNLRLDPEHLGHIERSPARPTLLDCLIQHF
jgi:hypothetical protein